MKKPLVIVLSIVVALFILAVVKDLVIKISVEKGIEVVTGLKVGMRHLSVGIIRPVVDIKGLKVYNGGAFEEKVMVEMPQIYVDYDLAAILGGKIHLRKLYLNLKEFNVVKNSKGALNLDSLKVVITRKEGKSQSGEAKGLPPIQIDDLRLKIWKATYKDYSSGAAPSIKEFNVNIDERYSNVTNPYAIVSLIVVKSLANTTISNMAGFDLSGLQGTVANTLSSARETTEKTVTAAQETVSKTTETLGGLFK